MLRGDWLSGAEIASYLRTFIFYLNKKKRAKKSHPPGRRAGFKGPSTTTMRCRKRQQNHILFEFFLRHTFTMIFEG